MIPWLSILIFLPLAAMLLVLVLPGSWHKAIRLTALGTALAQFVLFFVAVLPAYQAAGPDELGFHLTEFSSWIELRLGSEGSLRMDYQLAMDGLSLVLVLLTVIILPIATLSSFGIQKRVKAYFALFLLLNASMIGCFLALDFFLFYIFYELMLLPMFFLIGMWGGARREYAAIKFFLYTLFGSVFMLLIMVGLAFSFTDPGASSVGSPVYTFNMMHMLGGAEPVSGSLFDVGHTLLGVDARSLAFLVLFIGFAIKIPAVPVHTWLPDAHVEAPTPISVILAAILLKVGGYGIIRICYGIFPEAGLNYATFVAALGVVSILYGALVAMSQRDLKSLIAYSSISHMGFVLLGIASMDPAGWQGAIYQMFNHGIISAALFLLVGVIYDRTHDREIAHYSGLWATMPRYSAFVIVAFFASLGLPGLNGFVSEMMVFLGSFHATETLLPAWLVIIAVLGIVLAAVYYLRTFRTMFFGEFAYRGEGEAGRLTDLNLREWLMLLPLAGLMILLGIYPSPVLSFLEAPFAFLGF